MYSRLQIMKKERVIRSLEEMGLEQIGKWIECLPDDRWDDLFIERFPILAKHCGIEPEPPFPWGKVG